MPKEVYQKALIGRLPSYLQFLETINKNPHSYISAATIAKEIGIGEMTVRKDLHAISGNGKPHLGHRISKLTKDIQTALDISSEIECVLIGAGNLGMALYGYGGFKKYGLKIVAAFDVDSNKVKFFSKLKVLPFSELKSFIKEHKIKLAILTVPAYGAQFACDHLVKAGIQGIWNFSPKKLVVPSHVTLKDEDLALSLAYLKNQLRYKNK